MHRKGGLRLWMSICLWIGMLGSAKAQFALNSCASSTDCSDVLHTGTSNCGNGGVCTSGYCTNANGYCSTCPLGYVLAGGCKATCPNGYFAQNGLAYACSAGYYCTGGVQTQCPAGTFSPATGASACTACQSCASVGYYSSGCAGGSPGSCAQCTGLTVGFYYTSNGGQSNACASAGCPIGTYSAQTYAVSSITCLQCQAGSYASVVGATACTQCAIGSYASMAGASACTVCAAGSYASIAAQQTPCTSCSSGTYATQAGATTCLACTLNCNPGFWSGCGGSAQGTCQWCANAGLSQYYYGTSGTSALCPVAIAVAGAYRPFSNPYWPASLSISDASFHPTGASLGLNVAGPFVFSSLTNNVPCYTNAAGNYLWYWASVWSLTTLSCGSTAMPTIPKTDASLVQLQPSTVLPDLYFLAAPPFTYTLPCPAGTFSTAIGAVTNAACTLCSAGTWSSGTGQTLASTCTSCQVGTFSTSAGGTASALCSACATGFTATATGLSSCTACSVGTYSSGPSISCASCTGGTYASAASSTVCTLCVAGTYGQTLGGTSQAAACPYQCNAGYYGLGAGQNTFALACIACPMGTWGTAAAAASKTVGCPGACPAGTYSIATGQTSQAGACGTCATCFPGAYSVSSCTTSAQAVCALVGAPYFLRISTNLAISYTPATSDRLLGTVPYILTFTSFTPSFVTPTATINVATSGYTPQYSTLTTPYSVRVLYECPSLATGRVFVPWSPPVTAVSCTTSQSCPPSPVCDVKSSSQCVGGVKVNGYVTGGYCTASDGVSCVPCTVSATQPMCGWGMYGNISACSVTTDSVCVACRGARPANAQWVGPVAPYYFADNAGTPCSWTCNMGYYPTADGTACVACAPLPSNAIGYAPGDYLGSNPVSLYVGGPSKLVGGSLTGGCGVICPQNTYLFTTKNSAGTVDLTNLQCAACPPVSCPLGQYPQYTAACPICQTCPAIDVNGQFSVPGSCNFLCNTGYYYFGGACLPCTLRSCGTGYFMQACAQTTDTACTPCSLSCPAGTYTVSACSATSDRQCLPCTNVLYGSGIVGPECVPQCNANFAYNAQTATCQACATSATQCKVSETLSPSCDSTYWGCVPCANAPPASPPWCWVARQPGACAYEFLPSANCYYQVSQPVAPSSTAWTTTAAAAPPSTVAVTAPLFSSSTVTITAPNIITTSATTAPFTRATSSSQRQVTSFAPSSSVTTSSSVTYTTSSARLTSATRTNTTRMTTTTTPAAVNATDTAPPISPAAVAGIAVGVAAAVAVAGSAFYLSGGFALLASWI